MSLARWGVALGTAAAILAVLGPATATHDGFPHDEEEDPPAEASPAWGTYAWPVEGPVIGRFDPPGSPYGAGHRGIDIAAPLGSEVRAAASGVVAFAGPVAGALYVSIDHPDGVRSTYSWVGAVLVRRGDPVSREEAIARSGLCSRRDAEHLIEEGRVAVDTVGVKNRATSAQRQAGVHGQPVKVFRLDVLQHVARNRVHNGEIAAAVYDMHHPGHQLVALGSLIVEGVQVEGQAAGDRQGLDG